MKKKNSLVSIGMPVCNGAKFITEALDSILNQTFENFELIVSDNASTDETGKICREYMAKDSCIRYYRSKQNFGAAWNFNHVFKLSSGKYFKWAAHDDVIAPDFPLKCVEVLERDPSVVLCHFQRNCARTSF
jgi:glycosyltransferase involved in cell wall biosynthesis